MTTSSMVEVAAAFFYGDPKGKRLE